MTTAIFASQESGSVMICTQQLFIQALVLFAYLTGNIWVKISAEKLFHFHYFDTDMNKLLEIN